MSRAALAFLLLVATLAATPARADDGPEAIAAHIRTLMDGGNAEKVQALRALREIGPRAHAAVPAVLVLLDDESAPLRKLAALSLREIGATAREAVPPLTRLLDDGRADVREAAALSVSRFPGAPELVAKALVKALFDESAQVRKTTILMFAHADVDPDITAPALLRALSTWKGENATWAGRMLFMLGTLPESLRPGLTRLLDAEDAEVRYAALRCLQRFETPWKEGEDRLAKALTDSSPKVRVEAANLLALYKLRQAEAREALFRVLAGPQVDPEVRADAILVLGRLPDDAGGRRLRVFVEGLASRVASIRAAAASSLRTVEALPEAAVSLLLAAATDPDEDEAVRLSASRTLGVHGAHVDEVVPVLVTLLESDAALIPLRAVAALAEIGPPARAAIPALERLLAGGNPLLRADVKRALGAIGGGKDE